MDASIPTFMLVGLFSRDVTKTPAEGTIDQAVWERYNSLPTPDFTDKDGKPSRKPANLGSGLDS